jgi:hypothetical protein
MNNLNNYEMLSRSLKEERDAYAQRFEDKQDRKNEQMALTYEGLTAPFIEQSGMNILKKGLRYGAKQLGFNDEQLAKIEEIGNHIKEGDIGSAINKTRSLGAKDLLNEEQQNFLRDQANKLEELKNPKDLIKKTVDKIKSEPTETLTDRGDIPRIDTVSDTKPSLPLRQDLDTGDIKFSILDAGTGQEIKPKLPQPVQTEQKPVLDDDGNEIPDENEVIRNKLEDIVNDPNASDIELKQAQRGLKNLIEETKAPQPESTYQSAMDFLAGKKGTASAKWKRAPVEMDDLSNFRPEPTATINPRDVAPDIKIGARSDYTRGQNIKIKPDSKPASAENPKPVETVEEPAEAPTPKTFTDDDIANDFSKLSQEGRMNYLKTINSLKGEPANSAKATLLGIEDLNDNFESRGQYASDIDKASIKKITNEKKQELSDRFNKLSDEGKQAVKDDRLKISQEATVRRNNIPTEMNEQLIEKQEQEDQAQKRGQYEEPGTEEQDKPSAETTEEPTIEKPPAPAEESTDTLGSRAETAGEEFGEIEAETGGPEDIAGDIIAGAVSLGTLLFGLGKAHHTSAPPPIQQINPTIQEGQGQI